MKKLLLICLCLLSAPVAAQAPVSVSDVIAAYRVAIDESQGRVEDAYLRVTETKEFQKWDALRKRHEALQGRLTAALLEKTGKTIDWKTGSLSEPKENGSK